ncbi:CDP-alcohol phosphatidyltransferase family protein [Candidatus Nitrosocosmicus arcticus]|uniref:CDP-diacylglycerol--glycerol-3-phosphate 3-phosphatidyltransferase n=1 Tax=Candidatus Nitrosocosmicus arcticus TaxID=2035267 RepID=A0A557SQZ5_9ARCH|nr:CDP-alcohol phosphatidyltransferase family protein [Candidatus Nitrosocosmicus arcticus]TVP39025.1 CDP-diacylglycerol--glycerol-3-phosphate 3-phosphatidyltransferase [Candidatus Nitrosocosmicus arcticus]
MLNNLRNRFDPILEKVGRGFASLGFGPSFWTWIGLVLTIISAIMFSLHSPAIGVDWYTATFLGSLFLILAGFFDIVDGAVARVTKRTSSLGGYLDSVVDKVSEIIIFVGILIGNFTNPILVLVALSLSMLVSYTRARGEGLGVDLKGKGIAERAERILIIVILGFIPFQENISVALWIISILSAITVLQRLKIVAAKFGTPLFSIQTFKDMYSRNHEYDLSSGTMTSRLNEPPTSLSKLTNNVDDYLEKPDSKKMKTSDEHSKSTSTTTSPPPPSAASKTVTKAEFLDKTDPNETGRNVAQIVFEQEGEDEIYKKFTKGNAASNTSSNTDTNNNNTESNTSSNTDTNNNNTESNTSSNTDTNNNNTTKPSPRTNQNPENNQ